jgi:hypothetical protein
MLLILISQVLKGVNSRVTPRYKITIKELVAIRYDIPKIKSGVVG